MGALSDVGLRAWIKAGEPAVKSDGDGLTFTLSSKGTATWTLRYRIGGKQRELTLGRYPDLSLNEARKLAATKRVDVQQLVDVATIKQQQKADIKQAGTVAELAELWLNHSVRGKHRYPNVTVNAVMRNIVSVLGKRAPKEITRQELVRLLAKITGSGKPTVANDVLRYLRSMLDYGEVLGYVDRNPTDGIKLSHAGGKEEARTRALSQNELTQLFKAIRDGAPSFTRDNQLAVKLLLVLGCRKMELLASTWTEYDLDAGVWRLPSTRTKTGESRELALPAPVISWLEELKVRSCNSAYVFPARRAGIRFEHVSPDTLNAALKALSHGLEAFTVHDLRRTARSLMGDIGIDFAVAEKILGHKLPGTAAIYDRGNSIERQRSALDKLAALIVELDTGKTAENVILINRNKTA